MTASQSAHRRRHRQRSPIRRLARFVGAGHDRTGAAILVIAMAVLVIGAAIVLGGRTPTDGVAVVPPSASPSIPRPTPTLPAVGASPSVGSPSPSANTGIVATRIRIERLGIDLRIVEGDGVDAPLNKAAHYPGTGWPGGGTNIYIYGHAQTGMFLTLWDAEVGDEVDLDLTDGTTRGYTVTLVKPKVPWNALEYVAPTPSEQLTLQTSTSNTSTAPRFVVIAEPNP